MYWARLLLLLLMAMPAWSGDDHTLLDFELRSLEGPERHSLKQYRGTPVMMMFFEPDCPWCFKQVRVFNQLSQECAGGVRPLAVGVNGSRRELLAEYRKSKPEFPAYQGSASLLEAIGGVPATPFTLVANEQGQPLGWLRGYMDAARLKTLIKQQFGGGCTA